MSVVGVGKVVRRPKARLLPACRVVFSGSLDGHLRAYANADGKVLWELNTGVDFQSVNGVDAKGGSLDGAGPTIANGSVFVMSGYGRLGGYGGNALIAFTVDGK